jgi:hypothetical protein
VGEDLDASVAPVSETMVIEKIGTYSGVIMEVEVKETEKTQGLSR